MSDHHDTQVIAPYLIVLRVAKRRELTNKTITVGSAGIGSIRFKSQGTTDDDTTLPCGSLTSPMRWGDEGEAPDEVDGRVEIGTEESFTSWRGVRGR